MSSGGENNDKGDLWDEQKLAQLMHFADATPEQKLEWLEEVFSIFSQFLPARDAD